MAWRDSTETFGLGSRIFHWLSVIAVFGAWTVGIWMTELETGDPRNPELDAHTAFGLAVFTLAALRVIWRLNNPLPAPVPGMTDLQHLMARGGHLGLYALMFAIPIIGITMTWCEGRSLHLFWLHDIRPPFETQNAELGELLELVHETLAFLLAALVAGHIGAALYHHFICRDCTLRRMLTGRTS